MDEVKSKKYESVNSTSENTAPKKTLTFAKNTMPKTAPSKMKANTKGTPKIKSSKSLTTMTTTATGLSPNDCEMETAYSLLLMNTQGPKRCEC